MRSIRFLLLPGPNPDAFFAELAAWLGRKPFDENAPAPPYAQTRMLLEAETGVLLVLDGLEKV